MAIIRRAGEIVELFMFKVVALEEFVPIVRFNRQIFSRPNSMKIVVTDRYTLSEKIEENKRDIDLFSISLLPGEYTFPFNVEKGFSTWDDDGYIEPRIEPETDNIVITSNSKIKAKYNDKIDMTLNIKSNESRHFYINFYANDDEDDYNCGEFKNIHCGRIEVNVTGASVVGFRLIENIDALPNAPAGYSSPEWNTSDPDEIALSQQLANMYNNCEGICYATSESRAQRAYIDITGTGVVNLAVNNRNVDHRIASTQGTNDPFMGYGAGGPFALHGYGNAIDNVDVWGGMLRRGALLQIWHTTDTGNLYTNGGHSIIFRNYRYNENGDITGFEYTDYHGGISRLERSDYDGSEIILGVNLLDSNS